MLTSCVFCLSHPLYFMHRRRILLSPVSLGNRPGKGHLLGTSHCWMPALKKTGTWLKTLMSDVSRYLLGHCWKSLGNFPKSWVANDQMYLLFHFSNQRICTCGKAAELVLMSIAIREVLIMLRSCYSYIKLNQWHMRLWSTLAKWQVHLRHSPLLSVVCLFGISI